MRIGLGINYAGGFKEVAAEVADLERAGLDIVFVPEAYSFDAVSALGYLAGATEKVQLASGILQELSNWLDGQNLEEPGKEQRASTYKTRGASWARG